MKTTLLLLLCVSVSLFAQRHYGGMNNRYFPGAVGQTNTHSANKIWWGNCDDCTYGNVDFTNIAWLSPSTFMISSSNAAVYTATNPSTQTNWQLAYYSAVNPTPWLVAVNALGTFTDKGPVAVAGSWHMLAQKRDHTGNLLGISLDGANWTTVASGTAPTVGTGALFTVGSGWDGAVSRVSTWTTLLTNGNLTTVYNGGYGLRCSDYAAASLTANLNHCWDMQSTNLLPAFDLSGSGIGPSPQWFNSNAGNWAGANNGAAPPAIQPFPDGGPVIPSFVQLNHPNAATAGNFYEIENNSGTPQKHVVVGGDSLLNALGTTTVPINNIAISTFGMVNGMLGTGWHYSVQAFPGWTTTNVIANNTVENALCAEPWKSNTYVIEISRNDLDAGTALATIETNIQTIVSSRKSAGCKVAIMTVTPCTNAACAGTAANLATLNTWMLTGASSTAVAIPGCSQTIWTGGNTGADYVIDSGNETLIATASNTLYYLDGLHYTGNTAYIIGKYIWKLLSLYA